MENIITCDETWIFQYDVETKRQSMHWKTSVSQRMKKQGCQNLNSKPCWSFFSISTASWWLNGFQRVKLWTNNTIWQFWWHCANEFVRNSRRCEKKSWILHQDNAPAHNALSMKRYLAARSTPVLEHAPYSPDLAPCDFYLFPKIKSALKGTRFDGRGETKSPE